MVSKMMWWGQHPKTTLAVFFFGVAMVVSVSLPGPWIENATNVGILAASLPVFYGIGRLFGGRSSGRSDETSDDDGWDAGDPCGVDGNGGGDGSCDSDSGGGGDGGGGD